MTFSWSGRPTEGLSQRQNSATLPAHICFLCFTSSLILNVPLSKVYNISFMSLLLHYGIHKPSVRLIPLQGIFQNSPLIYPRHCTINNWLPSHHTALPAQSRFDIHFYHVALPASLTNMRMLQSLYVYDDNDMLGNSTEMQDPRNGYATHDYDSRRTWLYYIACTIVY